LREGLETNALNETVRRATVGDVDVLVALYRHAAEEMVTIKADWADLDARVEPAGESFLADMDDPDATVMIGELDGSPVGYAVVRLVDRLPQAGGLHARVTEIYVDPEGRAVGLGEEMITAATSWASERGAKSAEIRVLPGHRAAKNFCEENGFTARLLLMHRLI